MKTTTLKIALKLYSEMHEACNQMLKAGRAGNCYLMREHKAAYDAFKEQEKELPRVSVAFWIGSRAYCQEVVKIGKIYLDDGRRMSESNGYYSVTEIPEITDGMVAEMVSDSHYY